jgi:hypothetical protein
MVSLVVLGFGSQARADCCVGPPIAVSLPYNTPLASTLHAVVSNDDPDHPAAGSIHAFLNVGGTRIADLGSVQTTSSTIAHEVDFHVSAAVRAKARRVARPGRHPRGIVKFVVRAKDTSTGTVFRTYGLDAYITLRPPTPTRGPVHVNLATTSVSGAVAEHLTGSLVLPTPRGWPQTSEAGAAPATFGPLQIGARCRASIVAQPIGLATSAVATYVAQVGGVADTVASGRSGLSRWRVRATRAAELYPAITAVGLTRIARHRYGGARVDVQFSPNCPATAARSPALLGAVRHAISSETVHAHVQPTRQRSGA